MIKQDHPGCQITCNPYCLMSDITDNSYFPDVIILESLPKNLAWNCLKELDNQKVTKAHHQISLEFWAKEATVPKMYLPCYKLLY